jgi:hypothetical protein
MRGTPKLARPASIVVATGALASCAGHEMVTGGFAKSDVLPEPPDQSAGGAVKPGMVGATPTKPLPHSRVPLLG